MNIVILAFFEIGDWQNFWAELAFIQNFSWSIPSLNMIICSYNNFEEVLCVTNTKLQVSSNPWGTQHASKKLQVEKWATLFPGFILHLKEKTIFL